MALLLLLLGLSAFALAEDEYGEDSAQMVTDALDELESAGSAAVSVLRERKASLDPTPLSGKLSELSKLKVAVRAGLAWAGGLGAGTRVAGAGRLLAAGHPPRRRCLACCAVGSGAGGA